MDNYNNERLERGTESAYQTRFKLFIKRYIDYIDKGVAVGERS